MGLMEYKVTDMCIQNEIQLVTNDRVDYANSKIKYF